MSHNTNHAPDLTWAPQPQATGLVQQLLDESLADCPVATQLARRLHEETGTRMLDWLDHLAVSPSVQPQLEAVGFVAQDLDSWTTLQHPLAMLPTIALSDGARRLALKVDSVADFLCAHQLDGVGIEGEPLAALRRACLTPGRSTELWVVERHGRPGWEITHQTAEVSRLILHHAEQLNRRRRRWVPAGSDATRYADLPLDQANEFGFRHAQLLLDTAMADLGRDRACDLFFQAERRYWQFRNQAARIQKSRQDRLGMGWANHDHHTYRSSRSCFGRLVAVLERLGFERRERFYAGREAGWGAQVLQHPACGLVVFADVDLSPDELSGDGPLSTSSTLPTAAVPPSSLEADPSKALGTIGLWCRLHGEAFLEAGLHHLECQFDFAAATRQLEGADVPSMPPFTDFPHLRQAFTRGEVWPVEPGRLEALVASGQLAPDQANRIRQHGAIGSHLEILERNDGYKGFNQSGISQIIRGTDPRRAAATD